KSHFPQYELVAYPVMFLGGGACGMIGVYMMYRTPEPQSYLQTGNILKMIRRPLRDLNFRKLLLFNSAWAFSLNLATPFFTVYMLKALGLSLSMVIVLSIVSQVSSILFLRIWGKYSD